MGRARACAVLLASVALAAATLAAPARATEIYAALGDSYTAGPLIPNPKGHPIDCGRSDHNYPTLVKNQIKPAEFRDVSCGSAQTEHMTEPQTGLPLGGTNPPQFNALSGDVDLVTVGIGGNDMGFGSIVETCSQLGLQSGGAGRPCTDHYTAAGEDEIGDRIDEVVAPRLARVIRGIQERSPQARLLAVGDPDPLPQPPGCYPLVPIAPGDLPYLHSVALHLHTMKMSVARAGGAEFVDLLTGSAGHDVCQPPGAKWYEGLIPTSPAYPAHPNALGMEFAAREVLAILAEPVPNDFTILSRHGGRLGAIVLRLRAPYRGLFRIVATARKGVDRHRFRYGSREAFARRAGRRKVRLLPNRAGRHALRDAPPAGLRVALRVTFTPVSGEPRTRRTAVRVGV